MSTEIKDIKIYSKNIRIAAMKALEKIGAGHIGGVMSMADLMAVLYGKVMRIDPKNPGWTERDWLVVSKGHCGPAVYSALALKGYFDIKDLVKVNQPGTFLPSHCDRNLTPGVDMTTGSLGQGMSTAIGTAWGNKYQNIDSYTYLVLGDGESQEGQVWEGALFAAQQKVSNLIAFVDYNKKQLDGYTKDVCEMGDLKQKFEDFGWYAKECDGHDHQAIIDAINDVKKNAKDRPSMIVLNTEKGHGCSFAEDVLYNHHMTFTKEQVDEAVKRLEKEIEELEQGV